MQSPRFTTLFVFSTICLLLLIGGCAKQDLYEPPGANFTRVGTLALPSVNEGVAVMGYHAFVAGGQAGLHSIDFSDPSNPEFLQTINTLKFSESVEVVRSFVDNNLQDIALVVEGTEGVTSYDITIPGSMTAFGSSTTAVFGNRIFVDKPADPNEPYVVYLAESWKGVRVFESIPAHPGVLEYGGVFVGTNGYAEGIAVKDGFGYIADDEMGLAVIDVRVLDLDSIEMVSWADSPGEALDVVVDGDYAFVADGNSGLAIFRIDGGETPVLIKSVSMEGKARAIATRDGLVALACQGAGVQIVDCTNPRNPVFMGRVKTDYAMDLDISAQGYILVADRDEGLVVLQGEHPFADTTPPAKITSLTAQPYGLESVRLAWYNSGDDNMEFQASGLEIRVADATITDQTTWDAATVVSGAPTVGLPGTENEYVITGLTGTSERYFAIKYSDDAGLMSEISNSASAIPGEGILLFDAGVDIVGGTVNDTYTFKISYIFPTAPIVAQVVIDDVGHDLVLETSKAGESIYVYQTQLSKGVHNYYFHFEAGDSEIPDLDTTLTNGPIVGQMAFVSGSPADESGRDVDEWRHTVVLSNNIEVAVSEVTQAQWTDLGLADPSHFDGADLPVETVSWYQAVAYCNALSVEDGHNPAYTIDGLNVTWNESANGWRLPTEAEWEWLCRSGSSTAYSGGDITALVCNYDPVLSAAGWYCGSFEGETPGTREVSQKTANNAGLYDTHGNVWEWCWDWYGDYRVLDTDGDNVIIDPTGPTIGTGRVIRGGSWYTSTQSCRSANRDSRYPDSVDNVVGLRVVRTIFDD